MMAAKLLWHIELYQENGNKLFIKIDKSPFIIGRSENCDISLIKDTVSRTHAEVTIDNERLFIKDLGSTNGTLINGEPIKGKRELVDGDTVNISDEELKIVLWNTRKGYSIEDTNMLKIPAKNENFLEHFGISKREENILYHLLQGKSNKEIADICFITPGTAKNHILSIFKKTEVHSRIELATLYNSLKNKK